MNSDAGLLRLATKLGIPSFIRLGILSAYFGLGEFPVTSVIGHNFASERHYPECPGGGGGGHSLIKVTGGGSDTDVFTWSGHSS